jgi:hypothetical protein
MNLSYILELFSLCFTLKSDVIKISGACCILFFCFLMSTMFLSGTYIAENKKLLYHRHELWRIRLNCLLLNSVGLVGLSISIF